MLREIESEVQRTRLISFSVAKNKTFLLLKKNKQAQHRWQKVKQKLFNGLKSN